jgi:hypothetical protein
MLSDQIGGAGQLIVDGGGEELRHRQANRIHRVACSGRFRLHPADRGLPRRAAQQVFGRSIRRRLGDAGEEVDNRGLNRFLDPVGRADGVAEPPHSGYMAVIKTGHGAFVAGGDQLEFSRSHDA